MTASEETVARLEYEARRRDEKILELEARLKEVSGKPGYRKEIIQICAALLQALILFGLGYILVNRVSQAFEQKRLDLSNVSEMKELLLKFKTGQGDADAVQTEAAAMTLATFGVYAIPPLINVIQVANENAGVSTVASAEKGLLAIGWAEREAVCTQLMKVLNNRSQLFNWGTHQSAIRLLGNLECREQLPEIQAYALRIGKGTPVEGLGAFKMIVKESPSPSPMSLKMVRDCLLRTTSILEGKEASPP